MTFFLRNIVLCHKIRGVTRTRRQESHYVLPSSPTGDHTYSYLLNEPKSDMSDCVYVYLIGVITILTIDSTHTRLCVYPCMCTVLLYLLHYGMCTVLLYLLHILDNTHTLLSLCTYYTYYIHQYILYY